MKRWRIKIHHCTQVLKSSTSKTTSCSFSEQRVIKGLMAKHRNGSFNPVLKNSPTQIKTATMWNSLSPFTSGYHQLCTHPWESCGNSHTNYFLQVSFADLQSTMSGNSSGPYIIVKQASIVNKNLGIQKKSCQSHSIGNCVSKSILLA